MFYFFVLISLIFVIQLSSIYIRLHFIRKKFGVKKLYELVDFLLIYHLVGGARVLSLEIGYGRRLVPSVGGYTSRR